LPAGHKIADLSVWSNGNFITVVTRPPQGSTQRPEALTSSNGGASWSTARLTASGGTVSVSLWDGQHGLVVLGSTLASSSGAASDVLRTDTGGRTWLTATAAAPVRKLRMSGPAQAWGIGGPADTLLYKTTDGGASWQQVLLPMLADGAAVRTLGLPVFFGLSGVLPAATTNSVGNTALFYTTTDGGVSWRQTASLHEAAFGNYGAGVPLPWAIVSSNTWLITTAGAVYSTVDAGQTWSAVATSIPMPGVNSVSFVNASSGVAAYASNDCSGPKGGANSCRLDHGLVYISQRGRSARSIEPSS